MQSLQFDLYSPTGEIHKVHVEGENLTHLLANYEETVAILGHRGFGFDKPDPRSYPTVEHIIGYVLGEANTREKGQSQRCAYLYNDITAFTYKTVTVYEPQLPELPISAFAMDMKPWLGEPGAAPMRETAIKGGYLYPCDFYVVLKPEIDFKTGLPVVKMGQKGEYIPKKYLKVQRVVKYPYTPFDSPEHAIKWAVGTKLFPSAVQAKADYELLRTTVNPTKAADMWRAWVDLINSKIDTGSE